MHGNEIFFERTKYCFEGTNRLCVQTNYHFGRTSNNTWKQNISWERNNILYVRNNNLWIQNAYYVGTKGISWERNQSMYYNEQRPFLGSLYDDEEVKYRNANNVTVAENLVMSVSGFLTTFATAA